VRELIEQEGASVVLLLPPYSPDFFNPIEEAFSKVKGFS
jgi:transposase